MSDIYRTISEVVGENPGTDSDSLAASILKRINKTDLLPLLIDAVRGAQRTVYRDREQEVIRELMGRSTARKPGPLVANPALAALMTSRFRPGDGTEVDFAFATVEQHEQRVHLLSQMRAGLERTIALHQAAIDRLRATGVKCLADLPDEEAA